MDDLSTNTKIGLGVALVAAVGVGAYILYGDGEVADVKAAPTKAAKVVDAATGAKTVKKVDGIIFCGAPGSGKGTQCEKLVSEFGYVHLSTGDLLRAAVKAESELGLKAKSYMDAGALVPDDLVIGLVNEKMDNPDVTANGWILDGFPRTAVQAQALKDAGCSPDCVILLEVDDSILLDRITGRRSDSLTKKIYNMNFNAPTDPEILARLTQRKDDTEEALAPRLAAFHKNVTAICDFYEKEETVNVVTVDGTQTPTEVYSEVKEAVVV